MRVKKQPKYFIAIEWLLSLLLVFILIIMVIWFWKERKTETMEEATRVYFIGNAYDYSEDAKLIFDGEEVYINDGNTETALKLGDNPVIAQKGMKLILPENMIYHSGQGDAGLYRLNHFATLTNQNNGLIAVTTGENTVQIEKGFLYDGNNLYIFLEEMKIYIGEKEYSVGPLSYAKVQYQTDIELYNSTNNKYEWIVTPQLDVYAKSEEGYQLNLSTDVYEADGEERILFSSVDLLEVLQ